MPEAMKAAVYKPLQSDEPILANSDLENIAASNLQSCVSNEDVSFASEENNNHAGVKLPNSTSFSKLCGNIKLGTLNLNEEEEKVLSEMMASSPGDCNVSLMFSK